MFESDLNSIADSIRKIFAGQGINFADEIKWQSTPFAGQWGMGTNVCFQAAAVEARSGKKVNVPARAAELAQLVAERVGVPPGFSRVVADKAYVNVYFDTSTYAARVVDTGINAGENFGRGALKNERLMVEYAQPNTHHSFHIGHARNAILGEVLARIAAFAGFDVIRASYPGDMGLTVITCVWAYAKFYKGQEPPGLHERGRWIAKVYHEAHKLVAPKEDETPEEKAQREAYDAERREWNRRWDAGDPEVRELWRTTRQWSLDELAEILQMLDIKIDVFFYESEVDEPSKAIVDELIAKGIADDERPSGGPVIVKIDEKLGLKKEKYRTNVILRSDGTTLYSTKDLALAKMKFEKYHVDHSIYVVDARQSLHLQQAFKILELWGYKQAAKCFHLAYGVVTLPEGAMSSRKGNVIYFTDVLDEAIRRVLAVIAEKNPDLAEAERATVARQVGLGAFVYAMLAVDNHKDIVFDWDDALSFDGRTAPYIQNAYVRANSILKKAGRLPETASFSYPLEATEVELIDLLSRFPDTVQLAAAEYKPLHMAMYAYDLAKAFHSFYHVADVLQAETDQIRAARLRLVAAAKQTLANALRLLDIEAPDVM